MMKKTIIASMFALSVFGAAVAKNGTAEAPKAKEATEAKSTAAVSDPNLKTLLALGMDVTKHSVTHVLQGGTPKVAPKSVGVVKN